MSGTDQSPKRAQLRLLGGFDLHSAEGRAAIPAGRKVRALLTCLALSPGQAWPREKLMALLWSDRGDEQARASLRQALAEMRRVLGEPTPVHAEHDAVGLDPTLLAVDVLEFERLAKAGKLDEAAALYRGPLLDGHGVRDGAFEDWIRVERTRLHDLAVDVLDRLAGAQSGDAALATAQRLLQLDPAREETHRLLMRLYAAAGQRAQALRQYEHCRDVLKRDLQAKPDAETERLHRQIQSETTPAPAARTGAAKPDPASRPEDRPSIAVLPFTNMSGDPAQDYFSDGITEDIITELSHFRQLFVTARNSSFQYRDKAVDIRRVARELGVQYVVEGSARKAGNRVRVTAQLIDGATGNNVWAERYDRDLHDILTVQSDLAHAIATRVSGRADRLERARAVTLDPTNLRAYDCYLRGVHYWLRLTREDNEKARHELEAAIRLDPTMPEAYAELRQCHMVDYYAWWVKDRAAALTTALNLAKRAVELDEGSSRCRWTLGLAHLFGGDYDLARLHLETGIELNPNDTRLRAIYGVYLVAVGRVDEAIQQYEIAAQLDPRDQYWIPWLRGSALFVARRYAEAIDSFKRMVDPINEVRGWLAASLAHAGRLQEAAAMLDEFLRVAEREMEDFPGQRLKDWESYWQDTTKFQHRADLDHLLDGLHKAGLPH